MGGYQPFAVDIQGGVVMDTKAFLGYIERILKVWHSGEATDDQAAAKVVQFVTSFDFTPPPKTGSA